jgi:ribonucleoside-diphosphate reductase beta chain
MGLLSSGKITDPNKILPIKYSWAREYYKDGVANNWVPEEVPMQDDVEMWKSPDALTELERRLIMWNLGFFSTAESLTANNIVLAIYRHITDPACRQYMLRQAYEEAIHTDTFIYCCDTLGLDPDGVYDMYQTIPSIKTKDDFVVELTKTIFDDSFHIEPYFPCPEGKGEQAVRDWKRYKDRRDNQIRALLKDLIGYYVIMEGIFFYAGFAMMLALKRQKKMIGIGEQFEFIMRDESIHLAFGVELINTIRQEEPDVWTPELEKEVAMLISHAVLLECEYAHDACPQGLLGINAEQFCNYVEYIADRRLERLGMPKHYDVPNPFPWMSQSVDLIKEKNFFETRVTEYQTGGLNWD